ncbi:MAG: murein L,D-transpeptidase catalytic domain family protein, partial [Amylibacter sp.]|nr:murein L,D-transpeptidase catalytic domain family protein [Amylibacter sp.]
NQVLYNTYVAHGKNSGDLYATHFSNTPESRESSLGAYVTQNSYIGGKGLALNLKGLESGYNNNAFSRRVVIHGAWYVQPEFIQSHGRAGRSWGCPAVSTTIAKPIINTIKDGSMVFAYYPDKNYINHSHYAHA